MTALLRSVVILKINPESNPAMSLSKIETVFRKYNPAAPFEFQFADDQYAKKFEDEERIGKLAPSSRPWPFL